MFFRIFREKYLLVYFKNDLVMGRAIVWEIDGNTYMDRVYTCEDYLEDQFIEYAKLNKWYRRINNSLLDTGEDQEWYNPEGEVVCPQLKIKLNTHYEYFPYVDSFRYYSESRNTIYSRDFDGSIPLDNTDGSISGTPWSCDNCGDIFYAYDRRYAYLRMSYHLHSGYSVGQTFWLLLSFCDPTYHIWHLSTKEMLLLLEEARISLFLHPYDNIIQLSH